MCHGVCTASDIDMVRVDDVDFDALLLPAFLEGETDAGNKVVRVGWASFVLLDLHVPLEGRRTDGRVPNSGATIELEQLARKAHNKRIAIDSAGF